MRNHKLICANLLLLALLVGVFLAHASFGQTKTPALSARTKTLKTAITKAGDDAYRIAIASYVPPAQEPGLVFSLSASEPVNGKFPYQGGGYGYLTNADEYKLPVVKDGAIKLVSGLHLESSEQITATERTVWFRIRKSAGTPAMMGRSHILFNHGLFSLFYVESQSAFMVHYPEASGGAGSFNVASFGVVALSATWQTVVLRTTPTQMILSLDGKDYPLDIRTKAEPITAKVGIGINPNTHQQFTALDLKAVGFSSVAYTDEQVRTLETKLK